MSNQLVSHACSHHDHRPVTSEVMGEGYGCAHRHDRQEWIEDTELLASIQGGCSRCFELLFERFGRFVFVLAFRILRQRSEAEDIVQEVFLSIYLRSNEYDPSRGSVRTWIAQFAHFKALMKRRNLQSRELTNLDQADQTEENLWAAGPSGDLLERLALIQECLSSLKPRQRRTVELIHYDGCTLLEASTILKQSLPNTKNLYYRAIKSLRFQLSSPPPPGETAWDLPSRAPWPFEYWKKTLA